MEFKNTQVYGFEGAFRGMRNPLESWERSDSFFGIVNLEYPQDAREEVTTAWIEQEFKKRGIEPEPYKEEWEELWESYDLWLWDNGVLQWDNDMTVVAALGPKDLALAQKLICAGTEHAKFMRQIFVNVDITAPIYWWKEFDTYKIGTTANSTSTMHKLISKPITKECFEFDDDAKINLIQEDIIKYCEHLRKRYIDTKDKIYWRALVQILPQGWLQTRTLSLNYTVLRNIYFQRRGHKLIEWHQFCDWIKSLPYGEELITLEDK